MTKKSMIVLALLAVFGTGALAAEKEETQKSPSFLEIRNPSLTPEKAKAIKSVKMIYRVTGKNIPDSFFMLRAKQYDKLRIDVLKGDKLFSAGRNGDVFWISNKKDGTIAMAQEDVPRFKNFLSFQPFEFTQENNFSDLIFIENKEVNGETRASYKMNSLGESTAIYLMWVDKKTKLLRKVEITGENEESIVTFYRDYKTINGIKLPGTISTTNENGTFKLSLITSDLNLELDDAIFKKDAKIKDDQVSLLLKAPSAKAAQAVKQKKARDQKRADELEKKIGRLKIEITAKEKELNVLANVSRADREMSADVSKTTGSSSSSSYYWDGNGWTGRDSTDRAASRDARNRSHVINDMREENKKATSQYRRASKKLVEMQIQLDEAERELKKLTEAE